MCVGFVEAVLFDPTKTCDMTQSVHCKGLACWQVKLKPLIKQVGVDTDLDFILVESSYIFLSMGHDIT